MWKSVEVRPINEKIFRLTKEDGVPHAVTVKRVPFVFDSDAIERH
jgi:hypothetical protein